MPEKFCDNEKCFAHVENPQKDDRMSVMIGKKEVMLQRYFYAYKDNEGKVFSLRFCDTCANVLEMIHKKMGIL